ncbi:isochorismate synthase [Occultella glacieicola]|uniref:isochorismate synthase n=1 Tax=Occultella glacieicola TaxID=2518684 RepID=A0ABY2E2B8_9MICO|nr:isochorismate synthase [Occultella glacieicola]TDE91710.1 isochorismate synthase [Occultella glacieicola]
MTDAAPRTASTTLVARTVAVPAGGLPDLLTLLPAPRAHGAAAWVRRGEGVIGWGEAARITTGGEDRFATADAAWRDLTEHMVVRDEVGLPGTGAIAFGSFSFAPDSPAGGALVVPEVVVGRRGDTAWVTTITTAADLVPPPTIAEIRARAVPLLDAPRVDYHDGALSRRQWRAQVGAVIDLIRGSGVGKVVMARDVRAELDGPLDVRRLLANLGRDYRSCWTFAVDGLVGATPELLVRRERGLISSRVLAGTIQRSGDDEADLARAGSLARSSKDLEEHEFAVDSLTRSLAPFVASTNAPDAPFVLHLPNVMHLASDVTAVLDGPHAGMSSLAVAAALHPTAAVCGTPTDVAARVIADHEQMDRARYAGPVGWIGADGDGEWGIALRSAEVDADSRGLRLFAGCGIVAASDPADEVAESDAKLEPMRSALRS